MKFSIIVVTYNPGDLLKKTLQSIFEQTFSDFEVIVKDAGSNDGTLEQLAMLKDTRLHLVIKSDCGIYDAMNQAVAEAQGEFVIFLNSGDSFFASNVLEEINKKLICNCNTIAYGDTFFEKSRSLSKAPAKITGSVCYRNIPCHQAIVYSKDALRSRKFDTSYKIRADFEHFMWSFYVGKRNFVYLELPICSYEGGGYSESKENRLLDRSEYKRAVCTYIPLYERIVYRMFLILTLHKVRGVLAKSPVTARLYQKVKGIIQ